MLFIQACVEGKIPYPVYAQPSALRFKIFFPFPFPIVVIEFRMIGERGLEDLNQKSVPTSLGNVSIVVPRIDRLW